MLACTDDGLLLGRTSLIERRDGRFVVRARDEIEWLLKCAYDGEPLPCLVATKNTNTRQKLEILRHGLAQTPYLVHGQAKPPL